MQITRSYLANLLFTVSVFSTSFRAQRRSWCIFGLIGKSLHSLKWATRTGHATLRLL